MIERHVLADGWVELTFSLPHDHPATPVGVAGAFNGWDWTVTPFIAVDGHLHARVLVAPGDRYEFRYRTADGRWCNDEHADDYSANEFGGANCVVDVSVGGELEDDLVAHG